MLLFRKDLMKTSEIISDGHTKELATTWTQIFSKEIFELIKVIVLHQAVIK